MTRADHERRLAWRDDRLAAGEREAWAVVNGFARYEVSAWGFVRNRRTGLVLKPFVHSSADPYLRVSLYKASGPSKGRAFHRYAHRLVGLYHVPGRDQLRFEVHHRLDPTTRRPDLNRIESDRLAWVTPEENRRCRGERLADGSTGPGRFLADVRAELAAEDADRRRVQAERDAAWGAANRDRVLASPSWFGPAAVDAALQAPPVDYDEDAPF